MHRGVADSVLARSAALSLQDRASKDFVLSANLACSAKADHDRPLKMGAIWIMVGVAMIGISTIASGAA